MGAAVVDFRSGPLFSYTFWLCSVISRCHVPGFTPRRRARDARKADPAPPHLKRRPGRSPSLVSTSAARTRNARPHFSIFLSAAQPWRQPGRPKRVRQSPCPPPALPGRGMGGHPPPGSPDMTLAYVGVFVKRQKVPGGRNRENSTFAAPSAPSVAESFSLRANQDAIGADNRLCRSANRCGWG